MYIFCEQFFLCFHLVYLNCSIFHTQVYEEGSKYRGSLRIDENIRQGPLKGSLWRSTCGVLPKDLRWHSKSSAKSPMHGGCRQDLLDKRGMGKQRWRRNYAFSIQHTNSFMEEHGKVQNRRTTVRLVRLYVQLFFCIGCCCASPVVWRKQKHTCASLCRCVCSMVTFVMWTVPLVYRLYSVKRHGSGFGIPNEPWWVI